MSVGFIERSALHMYATPVAHHRMCMCRSGDQVWRCLTGGLRIEGPARVRRVRVGSDLDSQDRECCHATRHTLHALSYPSTLRDGVLIMHRPPRVLHTMSVNLLHAQDRRPRWHHLVA